MSGLLLGLCVRSWVKIRVRLGTIGRVLQFSESLEFFFVISIFRDLGTIG